MKSSEVRKAGDLSNSHNFLGIHLTYRGIICLVMPPMLRTRIDIEYRIIASKCPRIWSRGRWIKHQLCILTLSLFFHDRFFCSTHWSSTANTRWSTHSHCRVEATNGTWAWTLANGWCCRCSCICIVCIELIKIINTVGLVVAAWNIEIKIVISELDLATKVFRKWFPYLTNSPKVKFVKILYYGKEWLAMLLQLGTAFCPKNLLVW